MASPNYTSTHWQPWFISKQQQNHLVNCSDVANFTCTAFTTTELPQEHSAHVCCSATKKGKKRNPGPVTQDKGKKKPLQKYFNLLTYKLHALGDYILAILRYGTTDNFSTQVVCRQLYLSSRTDFYLGWPWALTGQTFLCTHKQNIWFQEANYQTGTLPMFSAQCKFERKAAAWSFGTFSGRHTRPQALLPN